jgi:hypothetical protein
MRFGDLRERCYMTTRMWYGQMLPTNKTLKWGMDMN